MIKGKPADGDFFTLNKDMQYVPEFSDLISAYGEKKAGRYVWAIYLIYHPESDLFDMSPEEKVKTVEEGYLKETYVEWKLFEPAINVFPKVAMNRDERMYHDAIMLYEESIADARVMTPRDKQAFLKGLEATGASLDRLRIKYESTRTNAEPLRSAGEQQSGWASRKRNHQN